MKKIIVLLALSVIAGRTRAEDPNSMTRPTAKYPVTVCFEPEKKIVTYKVFFQDDNLWATLTDPKYTEAINREWARDFFRRLGGWAKQYVSEYNSDVAKVLPAKAAREKRDAEREQ